MRHACLVDTRCSIDGGLTVLRRMSRLRRSTWFRRQKTGQLHQNDV